MRGNTRRWSGKAGTAGVPRAWQGTSSPVHPRPRGALLPYGTPARHAETVKQFRRAGRAMTSVKRTLPEASATPPATVKRRRRKRKGKVFPFSPYPLLRRTRRASFRKRWRWTP